MGCCQVSPGLFRTPAYMTPPLHDKYLTPPHFNIYKGNKV